MRAGVAAGLGDNLLLLIYGPVAVLDVVERQWSGGGDMHLRVARTRLSIPHSDKLPTIPEVWAREHRPATGRRVGPSPAVVYTGGVIGFHRRNGGGPS